jgi:hypothetical protein
MTPLIAARRVRVTGLMASATDAQLSGLTLTAPAVTGTKLSLRVTVSSSSGGLVQVSGVIAYPNAQDQVIGHFAPAQVAVPPGGSATVEVVSLSPLDSIYADQTLQVILNPDDSLSGVAVGASADGLMEAQGISQFVSVGKGSILTSPYFVPAAIGVGVVAAGAALVLALD